VGLRLPAGEAMRPGRPAPARGWGARPGRCAPSRKASRVRPRDLRLQVAASRVTSSFAELCRSPRQSPVVRTAVAIRSFSRPSPACPSCWSTCAGGARDGAFDGVRPLRHGWLRTSLW